MVSQHFVYNFKNRAREDASAKEITFQAQKDWFKTLKRGFPGGAVVENLPANAGDTGSSPGLGRS